MSISLKNRTKSNSAGHLVEGSRGIYSLELADELQTLFLIVLLVQGLHELGEDAVVHLSPDDDHLGYQPGRFIPQIGIRTLNGGQQLQSAVVVLLLNQLLRVRKAVLPLPPRVQGSSRSGEQEREAKISARAFMPSVSTDPLDSYYRPKPRVGHP